MGVEHVDIVLVGGGSGGHITPLLAVATAIKKQDPDYKIAIIGQKGEDLAGAFKDGSVDAVYSISAGKFRRYHGESFISHLLDIKTVALNIRDFFRFVKGTVEARSLLKKLQPKSIFLKGGFVSVPVGFAARYLSVPYITHDSDAIPGLANRLTAKRAKFNTTALPTENYPYPAQKARMVGIPLRSEFSFVGKDMQNKLKKELGIKPEELVVFCTGGGNGAQSLNEDLITVAPKLYSEFPTMHILHVAGIKLQEETQTLYEKSLSPTAVERVRVYGFHNDLYKLSGAADVVIARGGATNIAEFAVQAKASIIVPSPFLTGGQQLHNSKVLTDNEAAIVLEMDDADALLRAVQDLMRSPDLRQKYSQNIHNLAVDNAADEIAQILFEIARR